MIIGDGKLRYTIRLCTFKILFLFFYFECFEQTSEENNLLTNVCCFDAIPGTEVSFVVLCFSKNWSIIFILFFCECTEECSSRSSLSRPST